MAAIIYKYFSEAQRAVNKDGSKIDMYTYKCLYCIEHSIIIKGHEDGVRASLGANSNLHAHLNRQDHSSVKAHYEKVSAFVCVCIYNNNIQK